MLEAQLVKSIVLADEKTNGTVVMGVFEYFGDAVNFKAPYDWETLDQAGFIEDLREQVAVAFDLPVYRVDVKPDRLLQQMEHYHMLHKGSMHGEA